MLNSFNGVGRITNNLELRKTQNGKTVLSFTIAIDKRNKKKLEDAGQNGTNFIRCIAWESTAHTIAGYCQKGDKIGITGTVETREYKHPNHSDVTVYVTEILVDTIELLGERRKQENNGMATVDDYVKQADVVPDDLPF